MYASGVKSDSSLTLQKILISVAKIHQLLINSMKDLGINSIYLFAISLQHHMGLETLEYLRYVGAN